MSHLSNNKPNFIHLNTAIIGAGVSGITAAVDLLNKNYEDFLIFEALDRVGGRCHTVDYGESFIEYGAQFIHGQINNPLYYIARTHKQIDKKYEKIIYDSDEENDNNGINIEIEDGNKNYYFNTQYGKRIDKLFVDQIYKILNKAVRFAEDYSETLNKKSKSKKDVSVAEVMLEKYNELVAKKFRNRIHEDKELKQLCDGFFVWRCKCENIENACDSMYKLSAKNHNTFVELEGSQIMQTTSGYRTILNLIMESQKEKFDQRLRLNHSLEKILMCNELDKDLNKNSPCKHCLYTTDKNKIVLEIGNLNEESKKPLIVICDNVICTMSLGFLKENIENIIEPPSLIPEDKMKAISRLGFGAVNKIFLIYEKPFWSPDFDGIYPINLMEENESIQSKINSFNDTNWFEQIAYFEPVKNQDNFLCAWIGSQIFENYDDEKIVKDCTLFLRRLLSRQDIPEPMKIFKSTWGSSKYFKGSYSNLPLGSLPSDFKQIADPICFNNKIFVMFAGEATIQKFYSTVHGAYMTGQREANRILNSCKNL